MGGSGDKERGLRSGFNRIGTGIRIGIKILGR